MDDDGDMAEMYLTEKKLRSEASVLNEPYLQTIPDVQLQLLFLQWGPSVDHRNCKGLLAVL